MITEAQTEGMESAPTQDATPTGDNNEAAPKPKGQRGGVRPGAGRKAKWVNAPASPELIAGLTRLARQTRRTVSQLATEILERAVVFAAMVQTEEEVTS